MAVQPTRRAVLTVPFLTVPLLAVPAFANDAKPKFAELERRNGGRLGVAGAPGWGGGGRGHPSVGRGDQSAAAGPPAREWRGRREVCVGDWGPHMQVEGSESSLGWGP